MCIVAGVGIVACVFIVTGVCIVFGVGIVAGVRIVVGVCIVAAAMNVTALLKPFLREMLHCCGQCSRHFYRCTYWCRCFHVCRCVHC